MGDEVATLLWRDHVGDLAQCVPQCFDGSCGHGSKDGFELGKQHLDRVQIRTVWGEVSQRGAGILDRFSHPSHLMRGEIVHDDGVPRSQDRDKLLLDIGQEQHTVDRTVEDRWRDDAVAAQPANEGGRLPVAVRGSVDQPGAFRGPPVKADHVRLDPGLVDKDQPGGIEGRLAGAPGIPRLSDVGAGLLGGVDRLFLSVRFNCFKVVHSSD